MNSSAPADGGLRPTVRAYRPDDLEAVYDICARTAASGGDARGTHSSDRIIGDVWAAPYATAEPQHAHILDDGADRAVGYIVGTADTAAFVEWFRSDWGPSVLARHAQDDPRDQIPLWLLGNPERMLVPELADYPAHLHIDILPDWQGKGLGRSLMTAFLEGLRRDGVSGVHLGVGLDNVNAQAFYQRLGFHDVPTDQFGVRYLARDTTPLT
ncbi:GNAT family N-acetyltransferase [Streptomyces sp. NPDC088812]|uniref:GNAT family N-acetyltransferase n=1 Tax=Streptomyces sp. NPDC088812 TaxID=3365905 RepID=UPI00382E98F1